MLIKSFAKINLSLQIKGVRPDGYHELEMVNLPLSLHDVIEIDVSPRYVNTYIVCDDLALMSMKSNLCTKAVDAMRAHYGFKDNFMIHIHKEIPFAAGLGGGSSNAACVMLGLDKMLKLHAKKEDLVEIGKGLGADVPYFLDPHPAIVEGIGEKFTPIEVKKRYFCLLVKPEKGLFTKDVYAKCDEFPRQIIDTGLVLKGLKEGDDSLIASNRGNDLYRAAESLLPEIKTIVESLREDGFEIASMSGSGSCCYALTCDQKKAAKAAKKYTKQGHVSLVCEILR